MKYPEPLQEIARGRYVGTAELVGLGIIGIALILLGTGASFTYPGLFSLVIEVGILFFLYSLVVLGLNLQFGYTGIVNFGPVLFFALGLYATAMISATGSYAGMTFGLPWWIGLLGGIGIAAVAGLFLGMTTLQLRDDYLAIVTLAAAEIFHSVVESVGTFGGGLGITGVPQILSGLAVSHEMEQVSYFLIFGGILVVLYGVFQRLSTSPYGRVLRAIRADQEVSQALGKNVFKYKTQVLVFSAAIAGLAGGLYALFAGTASPAQASLDVTLTVWVGMLIGGMGNHKGAIAGLLVVLSFQTSIRFLNSFTDISGIFFGSVQLVLYGLLIVLVIRFRPEGMWGNPNELRVGD
jgi:branched-chain amino acid transport system permease protein